MNNNSLQVEPGLGLSFQDRIDILFHEIELAVRWDRPSILFAIYKSEIIRDEVNKLLKEKLQNISQNTYSIRTNYKNQFDFLSQISQLTDLSKNVLLIDGFNWECGAEGVGVFKEFNKHREYFIDNNIRAIFWLYENEVSDFAANATECWILRHRVVEFVDVPTRDQISIHSPEPVGQRDENHPACESISDRSPEKVLKIPVDEKETTSHANALLSLGIIFWRKGNLQRSLKYLMASVELSVSIANHSLKAQCQNAIALVHTELGNLDDAISAYQSAISLSPESGFLWNNLGQLLAKNERNEEAIDAYKNALSCSPQDFLSWDGVGHIYNKLGVFQNAISAFEKALEIAPYYEFSWTGLGKAYFESGQIDEAIVSLQKAVELNAHIIEAWINLGKCFAQQKRDLDAIAVFNRAIEYNPENAGIWDELGRLHLQMQNYSESISAFQKAININPLCGEAHIKLAYAFFQMGDYETAASLYQKGIPLFDDIVTRSALWIRLGDTYLQMKDYEKAIAAYEQSDQQQNVPKQSLENLSNIEDEIQNIDLKNDNEIEQEETGEERGKKMNEANHVYDLKTAKEWNEHGNSHLKAGAYNDAIVAYTKAIELAPNASWPYIQNLATVHYQKGKARGKQIIGQIEDPDIWEGEEGSDVESLFGQAATDNPEHGEAVAEPGLEKSSRKSQRGQFQASKDTGIAQSIISDPVECCSNQKTEIGLEPNEEVPNAAINTGNIYEQAPQIKEMGVSSPPNIPVTSQLVENTPQNSIDWNELGNSYTNSKKIDNAIEAYKKAIEMNPKYGQPYCNLGLIYYRLGKYDVAVLLYKKSIELLDGQEDKAVSWNRLGDAYRRLGDYGNALAAYQNASELAPVVSTGMARARASLLENTVVG